MRKLVIQRIMETKWYNDVCNEFEGFVDLEVYDDYDLLELYVKYGPY